MTDSANQFENYLTHAQELVCNAKNENDPSHLALLHLIETAQETAPKHSPFEAFLQGEHAFYSGQYQLALKHYLRAQELPLFKLFCYRASAYVSKATNASDKACEYAKKALEIDPDDYASLTLLEGLLSSKQQLEAAQDVRNKIHALESKYCPSTVGGTTAMVSQPLHSPAITQEPAMFGLPDITIPHDKREASSNPQIMQRLYSSPMASSESDTSHVSAAHAPSMQHPQAATLAQLKTRFRAVPPAHEGSISKASHQQSSQNDAATALQDRIALHHMQQTNRLKQYLESLKLCPNAPESGLFMIQGWSPVPSYPNPHVDHDRKMNSGFYLRWNGQGIVVNPGRHFLDNLHQQGLHVRDIRAIIVTSSDPETYVDIDAIYELNYQLNKVSEEPQIIHYFLNPKAYYSLANSLKPHFKQERNSIHILENYLDDGQENCINLFDGVVLRCFFPEANTDHIGITLDLTESYSSGSQRIGYATRLPWSHALAQHLSASDILIVGFGETNSEDYLKHKYNPNCLGYHGTCSLLAAVQPQLMLCGEFSGREGDIRLEIVQMLRHEYAAGQSHRHRATTILPTDSNLYIDLKTLHIPCQGSGISTTPSQLRVVASQTANFCQLQYLSPSCCL